jgi:predicted CoA-binding protein
MRPYIKAFFGANRQYVVTGASNNVHKFGYKILKWYVDHKLPVIPVNPKEHEILGQTVVHDITHILQALANHTALDHHDLTGKDGISISFLTPPKVTVATLQQIGATEGYESLIKGLWFQPGSYDQEVLDIATALGLFDKVVYEDECILKRGDEGLYNANL